MTGPRCYFSQMTVLFLTLYCFQMNPSLRGLVERICSLGEAQKDSALFAQRGEGPELCISGEQVLVTVVIALSLAGFLTWLLVHFVCSGP